MKKRKRMRDIILKAQSRRTELLEKYIKLSPITLDEFGKMNGLSGERVGQLISRARKDVNT